MFLFPPLCCPQLVPRSTSGQCCARHQRARNLGFTALVLAVGISALLSHCAAPSWLENDGVYDYRVMGSIQGLKDWCAFGASIVIRLAFALVSKMGEAADLCLCFPSTQSGSKLARNICPSIGIDDSDWPYYCEVCRVGLTVDIPHMWHGIVHMGRGATRLTAKQ